MAAGAGGQPGAETAKSGYATVHGLKMYYEIRGQGNPLVLLHGAYMTIDLNYGRMMPELAKDRQIIAVEQQGHGHTGDIDRPFSFEQMADDTAELLRQLKIEKADLLGYSMGGTIAIDMAIRHPELVRKLVVISAPFDRAGWYPEVYTAIEHITPEMFTGSGLPETYAKISPNPKGWPVLVEKMKKLDLEFTGRTAEEFRSIKAPVLILIGDSDGVPLMKAVEMFTLLGGGIFGDVAGLPDSQLAIIPGSTHVGVMEKTDWLLPMIKAFLDKPIKGGAEARPNLRTNSSRSIGTILGYSRVL
jgi:pimeloyl-ACP methyl ester carboxylesterase